MRAAAQWPALIVLVALSSAHCLNDLLQSVVTAIYPMLKDDLGLDFAQIGVVTLVYQLSASIFQPVVGYALDRRPWAWSLPAGMLSTTAGIVLVAYCETMAMLLAAVFLIGVGSSILHPEASRITSLAGRAHRGVAQSVFQVGGNLGGSLGPLLVALLVAPHGRPWVMWFLVAAALCFMAMAPICRWYSDYLRTTPPESRRSVGATRNPLGRRATNVAIVLIVLLIVSKNIYTASLSSYYTFYLMEKFGVSVSASQIYLFVFVLSTALGTLVGGPVGDRVGRKPVIIASILGSAPFTLVLPHVGLTMTVVLSFCAGFMLASAFPAILLYAQELLPTRLGTVSGLFFGLAFGVAGIASALLGGMADSIGIKAVYDVCCWTPLAGVVALFLPDLKKLGAGM